MNNVRGGESTCDYCGKNHSGFFCNVDGAEVFLCSPDFKKMAMELGIN
jgi:hypothetical protein